jgi:hypothetical protein
MYIKVAKNLKGCEKAKVACWRIEMVVTEDIVIIFRRYITLNRA